MKSFGVIARPLTVLTKKDAFKWTEDAQMSLDQLKKAYVQLRS